MWSCSYTFDELTILLRNYLCLLMSIYSIHLQRSGIYNPDMHSLKNKGLKSEMLTFHNGKRNKLSEFLIWFWQQ